MRSACSHATLAFVAVVLACGSCCAHAAPPRSYTNHVTLYGGSITYTSAPFRSQALGIDFSEMPDGGLHARTRLNDRLDVVFDARIANASKSPKGFDDADLYASVATVGPGLRYHPPRWVRYAYVEAYLLYVEEFVSLGQFGASHDRTADGLGAAVRFGIDLRDGKRWSIPLAAQLMLAKPAEDVSNVGVYAGVTYNFDLSR